MTKYQRDVSMFYSQTPPNQPPNLTISKQHAFIRKWEKLIFDQKNWTQAPEQSGLLSVFFHRKPQILFPLLQTLSNEIDDWKGEKRHRSKQLEINNYPRQFGADLAFWCNGSRLSTRRRSNLQNYLKTTWPAGLRPVIDASLRDSCSHMIQYQSQKGAFSFIHCIGAFVQMFPVCVGYSIAMVKSAAKGSPKLRENCPFFRGSANNP